MSPARAAGSSLFHISKYVSTVVVTSTTPAESLRSIPPHLLVVSSPASWTRRRGKSIPSEVIVRVRDAGYDPAMAQAPPAGRLLKEWRQRRHLSQLELAAEAGISTRHLSFVET